MSSVTKEYNKKLLFIPLYGERVIMQSYGAY